MEQLQQALYDDDDDSHNNGEVQLLRPGLFYKLFGSIVEYGAAFRGLRELIIRSAGLECTARIRFNTTPGEADHWGGCSPYWVESLGQVTGFSLNGNDALDNESQVFINHGWGCMRLLTPLSPETTYRTYVKMHKDQSSYLGDLYIFDSDGEIVGMYERVVFNTLRRSVFDRLLPKTQPQAILPSAPLNSKDSGDNLLGNASIPQASAPIPQSNALNPQGSTAGAQEADTVARVRALVSDEVGVSATEFTDNDDLAELGVDSLLALTMADRVREEFGVTVPCTVFMNPLTVRGLIQLILGGTPPGSEEETGPSTPSTSPVDGEIDIARRGAPMTPASSQSSVVDWPLKADLKLPPIPSASSVLLQGDPQSAIKTL